MTSTRDNLIKEIKSHDNFGKIPISVLISLLEKYDLELIDKNNRMKKELNTMISFSSNKNISFDDHTRKSIKNFLYLLDDDNCLVNLKSQNDIFEFIIEEDPNIEFLDFAINELASNFSFKNDDEKIISLLIAEKKSLLNLKSFPASILTIISKIEKENNIKSMKKQLSIILHFLTTNDTNSTIELFSNSFDMINNKKLIANFIQLANAKNQNHSADKDFNLEFFDKLSEINIYFKSFFYFLTQKEFDLVSSFIKSKDYKFFDELYKNISE